jgi:hypothetical protein
MPIAAWARLVLLAVEAVFNDLTALAAHIAL